MQQIQDAPGISPKVSVIIPCYRHAEYLHEAIESVLRQTYQDFEIIVIDDGSPTPIQEIVYRYPRTRCLRQNNQGVSVARNIGLQASKGEYVVFLDADDRLLPRHFERALAEFRNQPGMALVFGDFQYFGGDDFWHGHSCKPGYDLYETLLRGGFPGPPATVMLRRQAVEYVGGFRPDLRCAEDLDLWFRCTRRFPATCHHEVVAEYRRHEQQITKNYALMLASAVRVHREQWSFIQQHPQYRTSYSIGLLHHQEGLGEPLVWQALDALKKGRPRQALSITWILMQCFPRGFIIPLRTKLMRLVGLRRSKSATLSEIS